MYSGLRDNVLMTGKKYNEKRSLAFRAELLKLRKSTCICHITFLLNKIPYKSKLDNKIPADIIRNLSNHSIIHLIYTWHL